MPHLINPTIENGSVHANFVCTEPLTAICHLYCSEITCEEGFATRDLIYRDGVVYHLTDTPHVSHLLRTSASCGKLDWLDNDGPDVWLQYYLGDETPLRPGEIALIWNGEGYDWTYPA